MKRFFFVVLLTALLALCFPAGALAYQPDNTNISDSLGVFTEGLNNDPEDQAEMLKGLGLFLGTDKGFELDRQMTRSEAAAMLVRFLGEEKAAMAGSWKHPFSDVPEWATPYIGWLYENGLTKGVSAKQYGAQQFVTLEQYAIFLSRVLGGPQVGDDAWKYNGVATEEEVQLWDKDNQIFSRSAAVGLSVRALSLYYTQNESYITLAQYLVDRGVFTAAQLGEAAWRVLPCTYAGLDQEGYVYLWRQVAGVPVAKCPVANLYLSFAAAENTLDHLCASGLSENEMRMDFYQIDVKTMEVLGTDGYTTTNCKGLDYLGTVAGQDYLIEECVMEDGTIHLGAVYVWDGKALSQVLSSETLWGAEAMPEDIPFANDRFFMEEDGAIALLGNGPVFFITAEGVQNCPVEAGSEILGFDGGGAVFQKVTAEATQVFCVSAASAAIVDTYTVEQDMEDKALWRTLPYKDQWGYYYGEAGLYLLQEGRLTQLTSRPANDLLFVREGPGPSAPIILSHEPGGRVWGMNTPGGNLIIKVSETGEETILLSNEPAHGIAIAGLSAMDSTIWFYTEGSVGMGHANSYTYALFPGYNPETGAYDRQPEIAVVDYTAGRPEVEAGWSETNQDGYKAAYIEAERARLAGLGYGGK